MSSLSETRADFEPDVDYSAAPFGMSFEGGATNIQPAAEDFDPRHSEDLEGLLFLGYLTDDFEAFGHRFAIRTLRRGERLAIAQIASEFENTIGLADALQTTYVAACLTLVDGRPLSIPLSAQENRDPGTWIRRNYNIVAEWFDPVIEAVYDKYSYLLVRQTSAFLELQGK